MTTLRTTLNVFKQINTSQNTPYDCKKFHLWVLETKEYTNSHITTKKFRRKEQILLYANAYNKNSL